ncbi:MAG: hypothetical protein H8E44_36545 [Planctomycetes bacterium]|nr:hypothetical protein [Planctomycetota bacterium]
MASRSNAVAASRILSALSFWLGVMIFGIGLLSVYYLFGPGAGDYAGLTLSALGCALVGALGAFGYLITEYILPRVAKEHAWRLYLSSGLLGVVFSTSLCLVKAVTDHLHLPAILGWAVVLAFPTAGGALFLGIAQALGILQKSTSLNNEKGPGVETTGNRESIERPDHTE